MLTHIEPPGNVASEALSSAMYILSQLYELAIFYKLIILMNRNLVDIVVDGR